MKFIDTMILGAGHSIIIPNLPATKDVEALEDYISKRELHAENILKLGLFGGSSDFNKFYPELTLDEINPKDEDFIEPTFRLLSACVVAKNSLPTEFPEEVLRNSMNLLIGQSIYCDHETDTINTVGAVKNVMWQASYTQDGLVIPAGINGVLKIDAKSNPRLARGIMMDPPSIHSNSVTVVFSWKPSHSYDKPYEFWEKLGTVDPRDNKMVRRVATNIETYLETSLVPHGADPYAQILKSGKLNNAIYANRRYNGVSSNSEVTKKEIVQRVAYSDYKNLKEIVNEDGMISLSEDFQNLNTIQNNNETSNNQNVIKMNLSELLIPLCLALGIGFDTLNMKEDDQASITAGIAKLTEKVTAQTQELKDLTTKVAGIPALQALADIANAHITSVRSTTLASYKKSVGDESKIDANIVVLIEKPETNLETLISLKSSYDAKVEEMFPLKCQDCDSVNVSRASSKGEGESTEIVKNTSNEDIFETLYKGKL